MSNPVLSFHLIIYQLFTEVMLKCLSCLVSAENTCTFNNNKLFKKFKEKLAVTPGAITCIPAQVHEKMETVTLHTRMRFILPPTEGIRNSNGKGVQEKAISKWVGSDSQGLFFSGTLKQELLFSLMILHLTVIAECFFHSLPV